VETRGVHELAVANLLATVPAHSDTDRAGARQFVALLAELWLRGIGISVAIAAVISAYLIVFGGLHG
jgi:hypothetical protein